MPAIGQGVDLKRRFANFPLADFRVVIGLGECLGGEALLEKVEASQIVSNQFSE